MNLRFQISVGIVLILTAIFCDGTSPYRDALSGGMLYNFNNEI